MLKSWGLCVALAFVLVAGLSGSAGAVGVGKTCGAFVGGSCDSGLFCDHKPGTCRLLGAKGKCVVISVLCPLTATNVTQQVCGCNGTTYWNDCERIRVMVQKAHNGPCK